jgi:hypothetical protein
MMNLSNWLFGLIGYFSPSIVFIDGVAYPDGVGKDYYTQSQISALAQQIQNQNQTPVTPRQAPTYKANPFTSSQLNSIPFQASPSMMQAYNAKMQRYGITPQPFVGSPQVDGSPAPVKGGK